MPQMALGFYYEDAPVQINAITDITIGTHYFLVNGDSKSEPALIVRSSDSGPKITQAFALSRITSEILRLSLRDLD